MMTLATCAKDVKFYKWPSISYMGIYEAPPECISVKTISWSCAGNELLAVKSKGNAVVMNAPQQAEDFVEPFDLDVSHATVGTFSSTNPNIIGFGCEDGRVFTYDLNTNMKFERCILPSGIQHLEFSNNDQTVAVGCLNSQIVLCDNYFKPCASFVIPNSPTLSCMSYSKLAPQLLAAGSRDGVLALWDTETTDNILTHRNHTGRIADIAFNNNSLCTVGADGRFVSYDLRANARHAMLDYDCSFSSLAFLSGCWEMAFSTTSGQLRSYDIRNMKSPLRTFLANANGAIKKIAFPSKYEECTSCTPLSSTYTNKSFDEDMSASGDFSILTDSSLKPSKSGVLKSSKSGVLKPEGPAMTAFQQTASDAESPRVKNAISINANDFSKALEEKMAAATRDFEEKIMQTTYALRLTNSKQFIAMEEKIARTWNDFISYLRTSGAGPVKEKFSNVATTLHAYESCSLDNDSQEELNPSSAV